MCSVCSKAVREDEDTEFGEREKKNQTCLQEAMLKAKMQHQVKMLKQKAKNQF